MYVGECIIAIAVCSDDELLTSKHESETLTKTLDDMSVSLSDVLHLERH